MCDGIGPSDVGLPSESKMVVMVIGSGAGLDEGIREAVRDERAFRASTSEGRTLSRLSGSGFAFLDDRDAWRAFAWRVSCTLSFQISYLQCPTAISQAPRFC